MQRYFVNGVISENRFAINGEDFHHINRVMRMTQNDKIICVAPNGKSAECTIVKMTAESIEAEVVQWIESSSELPINMTIVSGLPKGDKLEWIIQKGTELGAHRFIPFTSARSIVKWDEKKAAKKLDRWKKIAKEASEQSHRTIIPEINSPLNLKEILDHSKSYDIKLIAFEEKGKQGEASAFSKAISSMDIGQSLMIVFGPEGGLTTEEVSLLEKNGFVSCGLGPRILRTETAPLYVLAAVSYHFELME
ncbi:16S rRNA (uracil(1498)-N(3))-methyltransferase [Cytobacillus purgationiresistens]|uniref:Ribosomal RNA small subunit methyltransferase E n=1 Tax=Cytobacillus purgationiresistens TaxID=863449 RepID=A0ABU0AE30_9BACI|nr:16S rRNA (uracil(1498)-N(3))-methyltransferase [Cytobacillus purgationiresistens]MDQ0269506.1 16S rRNA (uracil1498-N3)-methyltransferase [Cytobacillus purgationiresistens]